MHAASFLTTAQKRYNTNLPRGRGGNKKGEDRDRRHSRTIERGRGRQTKKGTYRERNKSGARRRQGARRTVGEKSVTIAVFAISSHPVIRVRCAVHCVSGFLPEKRTYLSHRDCTIETERSAARIPKLQLISAILPDKFVQRSHIRSAGTLIPRYCNLFLGDRNKEGHHVLFSYRSEVSPRRTMRSACTQYRVLLIKSKSECILLISRIIIVIPTLHTVIGGSNRAR